MKLLLFALLVLTATSLTLQQHLISTTNFFNGYSQTQLTSNNVSQSGIIFDLGSGAVLGQSGLPTNITANQSAALLKFVLAKGLLKTFTLGTTTYTLLSYLPATNFYALSTTGGGAFIAVTLKTYIFASFSIKAKQNYKTT